MERRGGLVKRGRGATPRPHPGFAVAFSPTGVYSYKRQVYSEGEHEMTAHHTIPPAHTS